MSRSTRVTFLLILALLTLTAGASTLSAGALAAPASQTISGRVFFDLDMDGIADPEEPGVDGAQVALDGSGLPVFVTSDADGGAFTFENVTPGSYTVVETDSLNKHSTTPGSVGVTAGVDGSPIIVNFGLVLKITVSGRVYTDVDGNGAYNAPIDQLLAGATVMILDDLNGDGRMDAGESILGSAFSDAYGLFAVQDIVPGSRIMAVQPAELGGVWGAPIPLPLPASAMGGVSVGDLAVGGAVVKLEGTVWNDVDGDELVEADEPGLPGVKLEVYGAVDGQELNEPPLAWAVTDADGRYQVGGLFAGWAYEIRPAPTTLPAGWIMSTEANLLFVTPKAGPNELHIGYYDPLSYAPLRQSDWKKELKQAGKPRYTPEQVADFIAAAEAASDVFGALEGEVGIAAVLLKSPVHGELGQALKEFAVLRLNLASSRLFSATAVNLPELTTAKSIGSVVAEIEGILLAPEPTKEELQRVRRLAEAINKGKGLGSGLTGVLGLSSATYRGASVVSKLRPGGDVAELTTVAPAYLLRWSPGAFDSATYISATQLRLKVKVFMDGAVIDVVQVLPDGNTRVLSTITPTVWNKDVNATYLLDLQGVSVLWELTSTEIRLVVRDINPRDKLARVRVDSAELVFTH